MSKQSIRLRSMVATACAVFVLLGACVSFGVDSYEEFQGALESGASCEQLFDIRDNFGDPTERSRIDNDLDEIGCESPSSTRTDT